MRKLAWAVSSRAGLKIEPGVFEEHCWVLRIGKIDSAGSRSGCLGQAAWEVVRTQQVESGLAEKIRQARMLVDQHPDLEH